MAGAANHWSRGTIFGAPGIRLVVGRHDLHAELVERILDVRAQRAESGVTEMRLLQADEERVFDVKVPQVALDARQEAACV